MDATDACDDKYRISPLSSDTTDSVKALPGGLLSLLDRSNRLYERISHMDRRMFIDAEADEVAVNPVMNQLQRLQTAFGLEA